MFFLPFAMVICDYSIGRFMEYNSISGIYLIRKVYFGKGYDW